MEKFNENQFKVLTDEALQNISGGSADWLWNGVGYVVGYGIGSLFRPLKPAPPGYRETLPKFITN